MQKSGCIQPTALEAAQNREKFGALRGRKFHTSACVPLPSQEVEGLTNSILSGPDTDPELLEELMNCVRRRKPTIQTLVNYKKGGVRFVNQVRRRSSVKRVDGGAVAGGGMQGARACRCLRRMSLARLNARHSCPDTQSAMRWRDMQLAW